ncbi:MAG TPA: FAD binding domain-containing protein [Candidatus Aquilonibacter sp.]|nr:FAD binding domain-containing protein [Candidatus Aquilonibacter sp.]
MKPSKFRYVRAETAEHAVELLCGAGGTARVLAGGQSLIPALSARSISASLLVDIVRCSGLDVVSQSAGEVAIGAACRQSRIERHPEIQGSLPLLAEALGWVAMPQVRSRGTVVGCLAQANPGGEVPVVALALDARLDIVSPGGARSRMSAEDVYAIEAGTKLPPNSLIASASFRSRGPGEGWGFCEIQLRPGHFALVCCAATLVADDNSRIRSARIAVGGLTASPYRAHRAEEALIGEKLDRDSLIDVAARLASEERPWPARTDLHATAAFRSKAAVPAVARAVADARLRCTEPLGGENGFA